MHGDDFGDPADLQARVYGDISAVLYGEAALLEFLEAGRLDDDCVNARFDEIKDVATFGIGLTRHFDARAVVPERDIGARESGGTRIGDDALHFAAVILRES